VRAVSDRQTQRNPVELLRLKVIRVDCGRQSIGQIRVAFLETAKRKSAEKLALNIISRGIRRGAADTVCHKGK